MALETQRKRTVNQAYNVELLTPEAADDTALIATLTNLVNKVYAKSEQGLWAEGTTRANVDSLAEYVKAGEIAVATADDDLLGCVRIRQLDTYTCEFGMLAVLESQRGRGIGGALVRFAEQRARDAGCVTMQLEVLVPSNGTNPAKEFLDRWYISLGYEVSGVAPVSKFYPELPALLATSCSFLIYRKDLAGSSRADA